MRRDVYSSADFERVDLFRLCTQICPPSTILSIRKLDTGNPVVISHRSVFSFLHYTSVWRTHRQICRTIYSACKASFVVCWKNWGEYLVPVLSLLSLTFRTSAHDKFYEMWQNSIYHFFCPVEHDAFCLCISEVAYVSIWKKTIPNYFNALARLSVSCFIPKT